MVNYANPNTTLPVDTYIPAQEGARPNRWYFMTLSCNGVPIRSWGETRVSRGTTTTEAMKQVYDTTLAVDPDLKGSFVTSFEMRPLRERRRGPLEVLKDVWELLTVRSAPLVYPTELWAVLAEDGILSVTASMDLAEEALYAAYAEDEGEDLDEVKERFTIDLKLGDWCLANKATGYRLRGFRITKVPATWSER